MSRIAVIFNPNSRKNRKRPQGWAERLRHIVADLGEVHETRELSQLRPVIESALERGVDYIVSDGGDGSLHWAANEALDLLRRSDAPPRLPNLVPTNGGTIDFVARKVGITGNAEKILLSLTKSLKRRHPPELVPIGSLEVTGAIRGADGREQPFRRIGFALAAGGIGQRFFDKYYREPEPGTRAILSVVLRAVSSYGLAHLGNWAPERAVSYGREVFAPTRARVTIDGWPVPCESHGAIHAGSLDVSLAGLFRVFPLARTRGQLHFQAGGIVPSEIIRALPDLYRGRAIKSEHLFEKAGQEMRVEALGDEPLNPIIDGEIFRGLSHMIVRRGPVIWVPRISA
jgi:diacylglycerol kinase family enzyme